MIPPDPDEMNDKRAAWASVAVDAFRQATGTDPEDAVADLVADLMHLCDRHPETLGTWAEALRRGQGHYEAEAANVTDHDGATPKGS